MGGEERKRGTRRPVGAYTMVYCLSSRRQRRGSTGDARAFVEIMRRARICLPGATYSMNSQEVPGYVRGGRRKIARSEVPTHGEATSGDPCAPISFGPDDVVAPHGWVTRTRRRWRTLPFSPFVPAYRYFRETGRAESRSRRGAGRGPAFARGADRGIGSRLRWRPYRHYRQAGAPRGKPRGGSHLVTFRLSFASDCSLDYRLPRILRLVLSRKRSVHS